MFFVSKNFYLRRKYSVRFDATRSMRETLAAIKPPSNSQKISMIEYRVSKKILCVVIILITYSCTNEKARLSEIQKLSKVSVPDNSTLLIYDDNFEFELAFKIAIEKEKVNDFLLLNHFRQVDTLKTNPLAKTSTDKAQIYNIAHSFIKREKIYGKDLLIFENKNTTLVVNRQTSELWGLIDY